MEWLCERCGEVHERNDPPCDACGHDELEEAYVRRTDLSGDDSSGTIQWVCESCGRAHPKHSPPCSRCGDMSLERREVQVDDADLSSPSYLEMASTGQLAVLAVALLAAAVLALGVLGVVEVPGLGGGVGQGAPDAPGNATGTGETSFETLEADYLATVNDARAEHGQARLERTDDLDAFATAYTRWWVRSEYWNDEFPEEELGERIYAECGRNFVAVPVPTLQPTLETADDPGERIAEDALAIQPDLATEPGTRTGIDAHAGPDGRVYLTQVVC